MGSCGSTQPFISQTNQRHRNLNYLTICMVSNDLAPMMANVPSANDWLPGALVLQCRLIVCIWGANMFKIHQISKFVETLYLIKLLHNLTCKRPAGAMEDNQVKLDTEMPVLVGPMGPLAGRRDVSRSGTVRRCGGGWSPDRKSKKLMEGSGQTWINAKTRNPDGGQPLFSHRSLPPIRT